jgi:hypothetical protein
MAYKYFTEKLLKSDVLDLTSVFPDKQELSREQNNVSYNLADIAIYLKDVTQNFKNIEPQYVDLDNAISEIVNKHYISIGEPNVFLEDVEVEEVVFDGATPREGVIVEKGEQKLKGAPKAAPSKAPLKTVAKGTPKKTKVDEDIDKFKEELFSQREIFVDVFDEKDRAEFIDILQADLSGSEILADDDEFFAARVEVLSNFIKELKNIK